MKKTKKSIKNKLFIFLIIKIVFILSFLLYKNINKEIKYSFNLNKLISEAKEANFVLLGESSHGTADYYYWRKKISQNLISDHNFKMIVVEGDWDSIYKLNLYIKHLKNPNNSAREILSDFKRWPTWMWANEEFLSFIEWLRDYNSDLDLESRVGIYGMDIYGLSNSMTEVLDYLRNLENEDYLELENLYQCLKQYNDDYSSYVYDLYNDINDCREKISQSLEILEKYNDNSKFFKNAYQNALVVKYGEDHYRSNLISAIGPWNSRVFSMKKTLNYLLDWHNNPKTIIWAHNTHLGDARATSMLEHGQYNIGQLLREKKGSDNVYIVGFGTYTGNLIASLAWQAERRLLMVPKAKEGSLEHYLNSFSKDEFIIFLNDEKIDDKFKKKIPHRAKGVVYNPLNELNNYVETVLYKRYDAFIFLSKTKALNPL